MNPDQIRFLEDNRANFNCLIASDAWGGGSFNGGFAYGIMKVINPNYLCDVLDTNSVAKLARALWPAYDKWLAEREPKVKSK